MTRWIEQREDSVVWHEDIGRAEVVAAGAAHAAHVPGVVDLKLAHGHAHVDDLRPPRGHARLAVFHDETARPHPFAMRDAAGERPPSGDLHAAIHANSCAGGEHLLRAPLAHVARGGAVGGGDHGAPPGRAVRARDGLDRLHQVRGFGLAAADTPRRAESENPRFAHRVHEVARHATALLDLLASPPNGWKQFPDAFQDAIAVHRCLR